MSVDLPIHTINTCVHLYSHFALSTLSTLYGGPSLPHQVVMSKIFMWYGGDFTCADGGLLHWLLPYLEPQPSAALARMLAKQEADSTPVVSEFLEYDWSPNGK